MAITIRSATAADKDACLALLNALSEATGSAMSARAGAVYDDLMTGERGGLLVADEDGLLLGMASISFNIAMRYGGEYCQLEELVVAPAARGKNVGARLVNETVRAARERGCADYGLYLVPTTEHNRAFYEKCGFSVLGTEMRQRLQP